MTPNQVTTLIQSAIDSYEHPRPAGTLGQPFDPTRVDEELRLLQESVVVPCPRDLRIDGESSKRVWLVAALEDGVVFYDEGRREFGLGHLDVAGELQEAGVYGDLVGTFMAR